MNISIADINSSAEALAEFFARNLTLEYISHAELMGYRALGPQRWAPDIRLVLQREIQERLGQPRDEFPPRSDWRGVIVARDTNKLFGLAFVTSSFKCAVPHGIIEDLVIDEPVRSRGIGETMGKWIFDKFCHAGINRVFLESGVGNDRAHHLFERLGFKKISVVMMLDLKG